MTNTCNIAWTPGQGQPRRNEGFSLVELLIAIAVFGVGLSMIAALLPAAISESADSYKNQVGMNMAESGPAAGQSAFVSRLFLDTAQNMVVMADEAHYAFCWNPAGPNPTPLNHWYLDTSLPSLRDYPDAPIWNEDYMNFYCSNDRNLGFALVGRKTEGGDYQIVSVSWRRLSSYVSDRREEGNE